MEQHEILRELQEMDSPLAGLPRGMPYAVPEGYFKGLADGALHAAKGGDVPVGYFQNLPQAMLHAAKGAGANMSAAKPKTRIISPPPVRRWAAAAVLLISLGIGGALLFNSASPSTSENVLAALPPDAVQDYVAANFNEIEAVAVFTSAPDLTDLSDTELEAYLAEEGVLF